MENPYESPKAGETVRRPGWPLLGLLFFLVAAYCAIGAIVSFVGASLMKFGFFANTELASPLWLIAVESSIVFGIATLHLVTGVGFCRGRFSLASVLAAVSLASLAYVIYRS